MKPVPTIERVRIGWIGAAVLLTCQLEGCTQTLEKLWEFPISSPIYSTPLVEGDFVFFGSESGTLNAVDKNGHTRWRFQAPSAQIYSHPASDGKLVFFGATNQKFYALDMKGQLIWQFAAKERIKSDPLVADGVVYTSSYDGHVYALATDKGRLLWQFPPEPKAEEPKPADAAVKPEEAVPPPVVEPKLDPLPQAFSYSAPQLKDGVLYVGNLDGYLYALQASDGKLNWRFKAEEGITSTPLVEDGVIYFGAKDDHVYAIDSATGKNVIWKFKTGGDVLSSARIKNGVLYIGSDDKNFYALDAKTGKEKCHFTAQGPVISYGVFYENLVLFGGGQGDGALYAIDGGTCALVASYRTGYKIESDPVIDGDKLYLTSGDRNLYAFKINKK